MRQVHSLGLGTVPSVYFSRYTLTGRGNVANFEDVPFSDVLVKICSVQGGSYADEDLHAFKPIIFVKSRQECRMSSSNSNNNDNENNDCYLVWNCQTKLDVRWKISDIVAQIQRLRQITFLLVDSSYTLSMPVSLRVCGGKLRQQALGKCQGSRFGTKCLMPTSRFNEMLPRRID